MSSIISFSFSSLIIFIFPIIYNIGEVKGDGSGREERPPLLISTIVVEPYLSLKKDVEIREGHKFVEKDYEGYIWDLAQLLSRRLGYTDFKLTIMSNYGKSLGDGEWDGIIGSVATGQVHVGLGPLTITKARAQAVDFSTPFLQFQLGILLHKNAKRNYNTGEGQSDDIIDISIGGREDFGGISFFLDPFTQNLWLLILGTSLAVPFLIFSMEMLVTRRLLICKCGNGNGSCQNLCSHVFGKPRSIAARIIQLSFWAWALFIFTLYAGNLVANRAIDSIKSSNKNKNVDADTSSGSTIESIDDLMESGIKFGILKGGSTNRFFENSKNHFYQRMYAKITQDDTFVLTQSEGIDAVETGNGNSRVLVYAISNAGTLALIGEGPTLAYSTLKPPCNLMVASKQFGPRIGFGVATRKDSGYSNRVNLAIWELKEEGMLMDLEQKWFKDRTQCFEETKTPDQSYSSKLQFVDYKPLDLISMAGAFYFWIMGIIIFFIMAIIEFCALKCQG